MGIGLVKGKTGRGLEEWGPMRRRGRKNGLGAERARGGVDKELKS